MTPSIYKFRDYREFLRAYYEAEKKASGLSFALFAKRASLNSSNYLKLVIEGDRNLTQANIFLFAKAMSLNDAETTFFECLVHLNQSQLNEERAFYKRRLSEVQKAETSFKSLQSGIMTRSWHYPICAVISHGKTKEKSLQILSKKYGMNQKKVAEILQLLCDQQVLTVDEKGHLNIQGSFFSATDRKGLNLSQELYIQDQIKVSLRDFQKCYKSDKGKYIAHTMTAPPEGISVLKSEILEILAKNSHEFDLTSDGNENLVQVNVQIFEIQKGSLT